MNIGLEKAQVLSTIWPSWNRFNIFRTWSQHGAQLELHIQKGRNTFMQSFLIKNLLVYL